MAYQSSAKAQYLDGFRQLEKKEKKKMNKKKRKLKTNQPTIVFMKLQIKLCQKPSRSNDQKRRIGVILPQQSRQSLQRTFFQVMRNHDRKLAKPFLIFVKNVFQIPNIRFPLYTFIQLS